MRSITRSIARRRPRGAGATLAVAGVAGLVVGGLAARPVAATTADDSLSGTVEFVMLGYDETVGDWAEDAAAQFEALHPDVDVVVNVPAVNQHQELLTTRARGGSPPDIAAVATAWVPAFVEADQLVDWTTVLDPAFFDGFVPALIDGAEFEGGIYSLPYLSTARALFYNVDALAEAGFDAPPATWDELIDVAAAVEESGAAEAGFAMQGTGVETFAAWFPYFYWSFGGEFLDADGALQIDPDACIAGMSALSELVNGVEGTQDDLTSYDLPEQMAMFSAGDAAMTITGPWLVPTLADTDIDFGVAPIPAGTTQATLGVQDGFVLFKDAPNPEAAAAFAEFLYTPEIADSLVEGRGMLPVLTSGFDAERYQDGPLASFVELLDSAKFAPNDPAWTQLSDEGGRILQSMYLDGRSAEDVCADLAASEALAG